MNHLLYNYFNMNVKANQKDRTFTIRVNGSKYRTSKFLKATFEELEYNTDADWSNFLATSNSYYRV
jgi:hypothetical protein